MSHKSIVVVFIALSGMRKLVTGPALFNNSGKVNSRGIMRNVKSLLRFCGPCSRQDAAAYGSQRGSSRNSCISLG